MRKIEVTIEKTVRIAREIEVSEEQYEAIKREGECPNFEELQKDLDISEGDCSADIEYDYAITDTDDGDKTLVDWNR